MRSRYRGAGSEGAICMRNRRSNFVFVRGVVSSTFALVYKENKTLYREGAASCREALRAPIIQP